MRLSPCTRKLAPARTTVAAIAARAGVSRPTVYNQFPDDRALFAACSARFGERNPLPALTALELGEALHALYGHYRANERMLSYVERDALLLPAVAAEFRRPVIAAAEEQAESPSASRPGRRCPRPASTTPRPRGSWPASSPARSRRSRRGCIAAVWAAVTAPGSGPRPELDSGSVRALLIIAAALGAMAVGFGASGDAAVPAYTKAQLAIMVLPKEQFGREARGLEVEIGSGYTDNAAAADATLDPDDTEQQLARAGRIFGYDLSYGELSRAAFVRGSGLQAIGSSVDLFRSAGAADAFITKQLRDARRFRGKRVDFGVSLVASNTFPVSSIGDRAVGLRTTVELGGKRLYDTVVAFRVGPLAAAVLIERADAKPVAASAERLARLLAERILLAAAGKLNARPIPVPPTGQKGRPPVGGPDLTAMALSASDLPKGTRIARQQYVEDRETLGSYEREFDTSSARFGSSVVMSVESDVSLLRSAKEAAGFFLVFRALFASPGIEQDFAQAFSEGAGTKVAAVEIELQEALPAGDEAVAVLVRFSIGTLTFRSVFVFVRVGRVIGALIVAGEAPKFRFADLGPLADTFAKRIQDGL